MHVVNLGLCYGTNACALTFVFELATVGDSSEVFRVPFLFHIHPRPRAIA